MRAFGRFKAAGLAASLYLISAGAAIGQELVYTPVNPSFGGDSFNSSHLLAIANAQNDYRDPSRPETSNSQVDQFLRQLQSRLLSSLAAQVNDAIFGPNPQDSGTITFGDQIITFERGLDAVYLTITDISTGTITEIQIPILGAALTDSADSSGLNLLAPGNFTGAVASPGLAPADPLASPPPLSQLGSGLQASGDLTAPGGF